MTSGLVGSYQALTTTYEKRSFQRSIRRLNEKLGNHLQKGLSTG
jgi:hypothetical protein